MFIMLNIVSQGTCAQVYARADDYEASYKDDRQVKIWHNHCFPSLKPASWPNHQFENDSFVTFNSTVPFETFCEQFAATEYNNPEFYHLINHNCANAAKVALQLAEIQLDMPFIHFGRCFEPSSTIRVPVPNNIFLTPLGLFEAAQKFKIQQLQGGSLTTQFSQLVTKLQLQIDTQRGQLERAQSQIILSKTIHRAEKRPHHLESCSEVLIATSDMLSNDSSTTDFKSYLSKASFFKHRIRPITAVYFARLFDKFVFIELCHWMMLFAGIEPEYGYLLNLAAVLLTIKGVYSLVQDIRNFSDETAKETRLSTAMIELTKIVSGDCNIITEKSRPSTLNYDDDTLFSIEYPMI